MKFTKAIQAILILLSIIVMVVGCATIIHGTKQNIAFNSNPSGAKVIVKGMEKGKTPTVISLPRGETNIVIRFEKEGYEPVEVMMNRSVDWVIVGGGNCLIFGGILGLAIDFATGAAYTLSPSEVNAVLQKMESHGMKIEKPQDDELLIVIDLVEIKDLK